MENESKIGYYATTGLGLFCFLAILLLKDRLIEWKIMDYISFGGFALLLISYILMIISLERGDKKI